MSFEVLSPSLLFFIVGVLRLDEVDRFDNDVANCVTGDTGPNSIWLAGGVVEVGVVVVGVTVAGEVEFEVEVVEVEFEVEVEVVEVVVVGAGVCCGVSWRLIEEESVEGALSDLVDFVDSTEDALSFCFGFGFDSWHQKKKKNQKSKIKIQKSNEKQTKKKSKKSQIKNQKATKQTFIKSIKSIKSNQKRLIYVFFFSCLPSFWSLDFCRHL